MHCYAESFNRRLGTREPFRQSADVEVYLDLDVLRKMIRSRAPRRIFLCDMTDLFGHFVTDGWIDTVLAAVAASPQHTCQILTKRAGRLAVYFADPSRHEAVAEAGRRAGFDADGIAARLGSLWPLANLHAGVSVEDRRHGMPRVEVLRVVPAVVRYLSVEPLIEDLGTIDLSGIDLVILGGESGPEARPLHPDWVRSVRDQCLAAGVPFFFKQWGEWLPDGQKSPRLLDVAGSVSRALFPDGSHLPDLTGRGTNGEGAVVIRRLGKKKAGRILDGRNWDEMPGKAMAC
jgi:protein gp37